MRDNDQSPQLLKIRVGQYWVVARHRQDDPTAFEYPLLTVSPEGEHAIVWFSTKHATTRFIETQCSPGLNPWYAARLKPDNFLKWVQGNLRNGTRYIVADFDPDAEKYTALEIFRFLVELERYISEVREKASSN